MDEKLKQKISSTQLTQYLKACDVWRDLCTNMKSCNEIFLTKQIRLKLFFANHMFRFFMSFVNSFHDIYIEKYKKCISFSFRGLFVLYTFPACTRFLSSSILPYRLLMEGRTRKGLNKKKYTWIRLCRKRESEGEKKMFGTKQVVSNIIKYWPEFEGWKYIKFHYITLEKMPKEYSVSIWSQYFLPLFESSFAEPDRSSHLDYLSRISMYKNKTIGLDIATCWFAN